MRTCAVTWAEKRVQALSDYIFGSVQTDFLHREFAKNRYLTPGGMFLAERPKRERKLKADSYMRDYSAITGNSSHILSESNAQAALLRLCYRLTVYRSR